MDTLTAFIGVIGAVVGGALTAVAKYLVQKQRLQSERESVTVARTELNPVSEDGEMIVGPWTFDLEAPGP